MHQDVHKHGVLNPHQADRRDNVDNGVQDY